MNEAIRGYATAVAQLALGSRKVDLLTQELNSLSRILYSADELAWALADTSLSVSVRKSIIQELLTGKLDSLVVKLVSFIISEDNPTEVITNLELITSYLNKVNDSYGKKQSVEAYQFSDEFIGVPVGRSATRERVAGFARAVFATLGAENEIYDVEDEIFRLARVIEGNGELRRSLTDWNLTASQRAQVGSDLISGKVSKATYWIVTYALRAGNPGNLVLLLDWLVAQAAQERNWRVGEIRCCEAPDASQIQRFSSAIARTVGHDVELRVVLDESVIGGAQVSVGDYVIDGTLKRKFEEMQQYIIDIKPSGRL